MLPCVHCDVPTCDVPRAVPSDLNYDGVIDGTDEAIYWEHYAAIGTTWHAGDFRGEGRLSFTARELGGTAPGVSQSLPQTGFTAAGQLDIDNRFGYAGYIWDQHLGIYHVRHRAYDPFAGRWLQPDPLALMGPELLLALTSSDGSNLYAYVGNNPNGFVDPYGLYWEETATGLVNNDTFWGGAVGTVVGVAGGFLEGRHDGIAIAANEFTFGKIDGLNEYSEQLIVDGGDWYAAGAGFSAASRNTAMAAAFVAGGSAVAASSVGKAIVAYAVAVPGATTAAPIVGAGAQIAGTALGGYQLGTGVYQIYDGDYRSGFENAGSSGIGVAAGSAVAKGIRYVVKHPKAVSDFARRYLSETGGRWGSAATRAQNYQIAKELREDGWDITYGGGFGPEEYIRNPTGGVKGSTYVDITARKDGRTIRVQTVSTRANGDPTRAELEAASRIRQSFPDDELRLIPKKECGR